jgi:hypothetical protein
MTATTCTRRSSPCWPSRSPPASSPPSRRVPARRNVVRTQTGQNLFSRDLHPHPPQHPPLRRLHRPLRHRGHVHRHRRRRVQPVARGRWASATPSSSAPTRLVCQSFTQDSNANYDTDFALLDVYKYGKKITQLAPEKRFYHASQTSATMVALHSTLQATSTSSSRARTPTPNRPIIKVFLNPLDRLDLDRRPADRRRPAHPSASATS